MTVLSIISDDDKANVLEQKLDENNHEISL